MVVINRKIYKYLNIYICMKFDIGEFDKRKKTIFVRGNNLYRLKPNKWIDEDGKIPIDPDVKDLILDINRHPFAYTNELVCQGHFHVEINGYKIRVDIDKDHNLNISAGNLPFREVYPTQNPQKLLFQYKEPLVGIVTKRNQIGENYYQALKSWENSLKGEVSIDEKLTNFSHSCVIVLASEEIDSHHKRKYEFNSAIQLNKNRLKYISSLYDVVEKELRKIYP